MNDAHYNDREVNHDPREQERQAFEAAQAPGSRLEALLDRIEFGCVGENQYGPVFHRADAKKEIAAAIAPLVSSVELAKRAMENALPSFKGFIEEVSDIDGRLRCYRDELPRLDRERWKLALAIKGMENAMTAWREGMGDNENKGVFYPGYSRRFDSGPRLQSQSTTCEKCLQKVCGQGER